MIIFSPDGPSFYLRLNFSLPGIESLASTILFSLRPVRRAASNQLLVSEENMFALLQSDLGVEFLLVFPLVYFGDFFREPGGFLLD